MTTSYTPRPSTITVGAVAAPVTSAPRRHPTADVRADLPIRWHARERWLVALLGAFVPMAIALSLPRELRAPLVGVSLAMAAIGLVMLARRPGGATADDWYTGPRPGGSDGRPRPTPTTPAREGPPNDDAPGGPRC